MFQSPDKPPVIGHEHINPVRNLAGVLDQNAVTRCEGIGIDDDPGIATGVDQLGVAFGLTGYETREECMGMCDVSRSVTPNFGWLSAPGHGGSVNARYFMPRSCHPSMSVTGGQCLAACNLHTGNVAEGLASSVNRNPDTVTIEHPSGGMDIIVDYRSSGSTIDLMSAGVMRTARLLTRGELMSLSKDWAD